MRGELIAGESRDGSKWSVTIWHRWSEKRPAMMIYERGNIRSREMARKLMATRLKVERAKLEKENL